MSRRGCRGSPRCARRGVGFVRHDDTAHPGLGVCVGAGLVAADRRVQAPRAEHEALEAFVGVWNFDGETSAIPELGMMDAGKVAYTHVNQMANGGYFLETRRTGTGPNGRSPSSLFTATTPCRRPIVRTATTTAVWFERSRHGRWADVDVQRHEHQPRRASHEGTFVPGLFPEYVDRNRPIRALERRGTPGTRKTDGHVPPGCPGGATGRLAGPGEVWRSQDHPDHAVPTRVPRGTRRSALGIRPRGDRQSTAARGARELRDANPPPYRRQLPRLPQRGQAQGRPVARDIWGHPRRRQGRPHRPAREERGQHADSPADRTRSSRRCRRTAWPSTRRTWR